MGRFLILMVAAVFAVSCIEPLELAPDIVGEITAFEVEGQIRSSVNAATRTVSIEVGDGIDLTAVRVSRIELVETASCDIAVDDILDLSSPMMVTVTTVARYEWTVSATRPYDAERALPGGDFEQWSQVGTRLWNPWPRGPETASKPEDGEWEITRWWDTGNKGVTILAPSNSIPTEPGEGCPANPGGRAARLESRWVTKVAGGNIYFGRFGGLTTDGTLNATCDIGHGWHAKPKALKGWYRYFPQPVDRVSDEYLDLHPYRLSKQQWLGSMDSLHINIALWASPDGADIPFTVNTSPKSFVDFRRDTPGVIAYASLVSGREQAEWLEFNLELEYLKPEYLDEDKPLPANTRLFLQATSSKNCNYFIAGTSGGGDDGQTGSLMYVDEFQLVYD